MQSYISIEVENDLNRESVAQAKCLLARVARIIDGNAVTYDAANRQIVGRSIGMHDYSTHVEVKLSASGAEIKVESERFSCREMPHFCSTPLPQTLNELAMRIPLWMSHITAATDPLIIQHRNALEKQAMDALQAAATAWDPDWCQLIITRYSSSIVHAVVHGTYDSLNFATASICPSENALPLSEALSQQLNGFSGSSYITGNGRKREEALDIVMWPSKCYIIDNTLSPLGKLRAIALAAQKNYRLLA